MVNCVHNGSSRGRHFSRRTWKILHYLADHPSENHGKIIAESLKLPYSSVFKTLQRLTQRGLVKKAHKGFWMLNHDFFKSPLPPRDLCPSLSESIGVHGVGLFAGVPRLGERLFVSGGCVRSRVFGADVRLYSDSAYFQEKCPPFPLSELMLRYEDFIETLGDASRDLAEVRNVRLNDYEMGFDMFFDMSLLDLMKVTKIIIYKKNGYARIHIQFNKKNIPLPLTRDTQLTMTTDLYTTMSETETLIDHIFRNLITQQPNIQHPQHSIIVR